MRKTVRYRWLWPALLMLPLILSAAEAGKATSGSYTLRKQVIAAGAEASGGGYRVVGTAAQPAAGLSTAAALRLTAGFHGRAVQAPVVDQMFRNGFE
ncbi:MAG: hypothetical protein U1F26_18085 [Lysobacterales bacterium]